MTNDEIKALKPGDRVRYFCHACHAPCDGAIQEIIQRDRGRCDPLFDHRWAHVRFTTGHILMIESDEYLRAIGAPVTDYTGRRVAGADLLGANFYAG